MSPDRSGTGMDKSHPQTLNRYAYVENNPLTYVDPTGKWSTPVHEEIIDDSFRSILTANERQVLKDASRWVDSVTQSATESFRHGMGAPEQNPERAIAQTESWIDDNLDSAVNCSYFPSRQGTLE
jgi:hypothetical protein